MVDLTQEVSSRQKTTLSLQTTNKQKIMVQPQIALGLLYLKLNSGVARNARNPRNSRNPRNASNARNARKGAVLMAENVSAGTMNEIHQNQHFGFSE